MNKIYQSERENLELVKHEWDLEYVEKRLLGIFLKGKIMFMKKGLPTKDEKLKKAPSMSLPKSKEKRTKH